MIAQAEKAKEAKVKASEEPLHDVKSVPVSAPHADNMDTLACDLSPLAKTYCDAVPATTSASDHDDGTEALLRAPTRRLNSFHDDDPVPEGETQANKTSGDAHGSLSEEQPVREVNEQSSLREGSADGPNPRSLTSVFDKEARV